MHAPRTAQTALLVAGVHGQDRRRRLGAPALARASAHGWRHAVRVQGPLPTELNVAAVVQMRWGSLCLL
eukprot:10499836-Lingulodinium_polyedra.AAC.1